MAEERITETHDEAGNTHTTHTIVSDGATRRSGGGTILMLVVVAILAIGAFFVFQQMSGAEIAKDNAVAGAADSVNEAADAVGEAAGRAGDAVDEATGN